MKVDDIMEREPVTIPSNSRVLKSNKATESHELSCLLVDEHDKVVGIITERGIVRRGAITGLQVGRTAVKTTMSSPIIAIQPRATTEDTLKLTPNG